MIRFGRGFLISTIFGLLGGSSVMAQPMIHWVSNDTGSRYSFEIQGSNFGPSAEILGWDDFESGQAGNSVFGGSPIIGPDWARFPPNTEENVLYSRNGRFGNTNCVNITKQVPGSLGFGWYDIGRNSSLYVSFFRQAEFLPDGLFEDIFRSYLGEGNFGDRIRLTSQFGNATRFSIAGPTIWNSYNKYFGGGFNNGDWVRWEMTYQVLNDQEVNFEIAVNGEPRLGERNWFIEHSGYPHGLWAKSIFWGGNTNPPDNFQERSINVDDVYVATSPARLEFGDHPDYFNCFQRSLLVADDWSQHQINFQLPPYFQKEGYIFVIDENGIPSNGYPIIVEDQAFEVSVDVKPGSEDNAINCKGKSGMVPVAILSDVSGFDATLVDHRTVRFGIGEASEAHLKKGGLPRKNENLDGFGLQPEVQRHEEDVNGDGLLDLMFHFRFTETGIQCGDREVQLTGETFDGPRIRGTAIIRTVPSFEDPLAEQTQFDISPNPFNPQATIRYTLNTSQFVKIQVYDIRGRCLTTLSEEVKQPGNHSVVWRGVDQNGRSVPSGTYFFRIHGKEYEQILKAVLLK